MMPANNLRSMIAQCYRGGRSVVSRRNFSSAPNSSGESYSVTEIVVDTMEKVAWIAFGYQGYSALTLVQALRLREKVMGKMLDDILSRSN